VAGHHHAFDAAPRLPALFDLQSLCRLMLAIDTIASSSGLRGTGPVSCTLKLKLLRLAALLVHETVVFDEESDVDVAAGPTILRFWYGSRCLVLASGTETSQSHHLRPNRMRVS
jgi:hypothetical protein